MSFLHVPKLRLCVLSALSLLVACSSETSGGGGAGGTGGSNVSGSSGSGGAPGGSGGASAGTTGALAGSGGTTAGTAGAAGASGAAGTAGASAGGASGAAGSAGGAGMSGSTGGGAGGTSGAGGSAGASGSGGTGGGGMFTLTSPAFDNMAGCSKSMASACDVFPSVNTSYMNAMNVSPELRWTGVPSGTQSFAVLLRDVTNGNIHWVLWNIPGTATMLAADVPKNTATPATPAGSRQANADFASGDGYFGPGSACNVYEFVVYALSVPMFMPSPNNEAASVRTQLLALGNQILGSTSLTGRANYMMQCPQ